MTSEEQILTYNGRRHNLCLLSNQKILQVIGDNWNASSSSKIMKNVIVRSKVLGPWLNFQIVWQRHGTSVDAQLEKICDMPSRHNVDSEATRKAPAGSTFKIDQLTTKKVKADDPVLLPCLLSSSIAALANNAMTGHCCIERVKLKNQERKLSTPPQLGALVSASEKKDKTILVVVDLLNSQILDLGVDQSKQDTETQTLLCD